MDLNAALYFYDLEVAPNLFTATFIKLGNPKLIRAYENVGIKLIKNPNDLALLNLKKELLKLLHTTVFIIRKDRIDDLELLYDFISRHKILVGFNSTKYDKYLLDYIYFSFNKCKTGYFTKSNLHIVTAIYNLSCELIGFGEGFYYIFRTKYVDKNYHSPFTNWDIQRILRLDQMFISLKQVSIALKWYRVQDLPYKPHDVIEYNYNNSAHHDPVIANIVDYNLNDVLITALLFYTKQDEVDLRLSVTKLYETNVENESRSSMASKLFAKFYCDATGINKRDLAKLRTNRSKVLFSDLIDPRIIYETPYMQDVLSRLKNRVVREGDKFSEIVKLHNSHFKLAKGGLHSVDRPKVYTSSSKIYYEDCDVTSFYPMIIINGNICPAHLVISAFIAILKMLVDKRVTAKHITKQIQKLLHTDISEEKVNILRRELPNYLTQMEALKIVVNAIFGKLGDANGPLYDLQALYSTTINGQLYLLKLIEMLAVKGFQNISANTDGIITAIPAERYDEYRAICKEWELMLDFQLEFTRYHKYVCYAVNDYIAIKQEYVEDPNADYIKKKGLFLTDIAVDKGYFAPIISKALCDYYVSGTPIQTTLSESTDIYDFCISKKSNESFNNMLVSIDPVSRTYVEEIIQKNVRFYISSETNGNLVKRYKNPKPNKKGVVVKQVSIISKRNIKIFNNYFEVDTFEDYGINYQFYYNECCKITDAINFGTFDLFTEPIENET